MFHYFSHLGILDFWRPKTGNQRMTSSVYVNGGVKTTRTMLKIIFKFIIFQYDNFLKTFSTGQKMPSETKNTMEIQ